MLSKKEEAELRKIDRLARRGKATRKQLVRGIGLKQKHAAQR